jgi:ATP-dependent DNA helicase RecG
VPEQAIQWLKDKLPNPIDRSGAQRKKAGENFYELVREGIVNALVHRNYDIAGAKCQLVVTPNTITIKSPGEPVPPITLKQLQDFNAPMLSRNPVLHYVFAKMELAEERGLGLKSMKARASDVGLPLPRYAWENPYLILTLYRNAEAATTVLPVAVRDSLNDDERISWEFIASRQSVTSSELMDRLGFDERKAQRILRKLTDATLLRRVGRGPATRYEVPS